MSSTRLLRDVYESEFAILKGHSASCRRQYGLTFSRWAEQLGRESTLADLDALHVQRYLTMRREAVKAATARKDRNQIAALHRYCAEMRYVERFPTYPQIRAPGRIPRGYTVEEVSALLRVALRRRPRIKGTPIPPHQFLPTLLRCCWETAERITPHLMLRWEDVDLEQRLVVFRAENRKGATRDILRPISPGLVEWLRPMRREPDGLVWPWTMDKSTLWHHFGMLCKKAGVIQKGKGAFHGLRKSAASYMALAGGEAAATQLLDHSNGAITKAHYIDVTIAKPKQTAIDLLPPLDLDGQEPPHEPR